MNMILLSLVLLAGDDLRDFVANQLAISARVTVQTKEQGEAIDRRFMEKFHWRLSAGSCGMMGCAVHGGGWVKERQVVEVSVTGEVVKPAPPPQTTTQWERRGLFRWVQVTVPVDTTPRPKVPVEPVYRTGSSCPNGQCPLGH